MKRFSQGVLAGVLIFFSGLVAADGIAVNPIRLELDPGQRTGTLNVTNNASETKVLQVTAMHWKQVNGESVYEPATDLIATPVLFRLPPKSRQLVRVGFVNPPAEIQTERSYRIYLTEVPENKGEDSQIRFLLRLGIPMFVPPIKTQEQLNWELNRQTNGDIQLTAENRGNRHVRLQGIQVSDEQGTVVEHQGLDYLLPGSRQQWLLTPQRALTGNKPVKIKAQSGRGALEIDVPAGTH